MYITQNNFIYIGRKTTDFRYKISDSKQKRNKFGNRHAVGIFGRQTLWVISLFFLFLPYFLKAQIFNPPYKAVQKDFLSSSNTSYYIESINPDSSKNPFYIGIQNDGLLTTSLSPSQMKFYDNKFKLIDAVNTKGQEHYLTNIFLSDFDKDGINEIIAPVIGDHKVKLFLIEMNYNNANSITFLTIPSLKKRPQVNVHYLKASNDLLIIYINTLFPGKHDYRRIYAINTNDFSVKWMKPTTDFVEDLFTFPSDKSKYFYFITHSYDNGLIFSHNTFYRLINAKDKSSELIKTKAIIDTCFGNNHSPFPDSTASDYYTDSISYLVKMDLNGNTIFRKKIGGNYVLPHIIKNPTNDSLLFCITSRPDDLIKVKLFLKKENRIETLAQIKHDQFLSIFCMDNYLYFSDKNRLWKNKKGSLSSQTDTISTNYLFSPVPNNPNYLINYNVGGKHFLFNRNFEKLAEFNTSRDGRNIVYMKSVDAFAERNPNSTKFYKLEEVPWRERLNKTTFKWLSSSLIVLLFVILLLWVYTMRLSRKKIENSYQLLQKSNSDLETTTSQLIRAEKLAVLGTIASAVAHQLNGPLGAILNSAQRLKTTDNLIDNANLIEKATIRSKRIVERFLIASRPTDNEEAITDLNIALNEFEELFGHQFKISGIEIKQDIEEDILLKIKPVYFNEVLTNLLFNAHDSIIEKNDEENRVINIICKIESNRAVFEIRDTGIGFSDLVLNSNFEAFLTTKEKGKGTGLGLWLVEKIISEAGGKIEIGNYDNGAFIKIKLNIIESTPKSDIFINPMF